MKRPPGFSRRIVDPANSVAWFAMDALWLAQLTWPAYVASALTLATGAALLLLKRGRGQRLSDDLTLNAWMWMNALWLISDLGQHPSLRHAALAFAALGAVLLAFSLRPSQFRRGAFHHFKKLRVSGR